MGKDETPKYYWDFRGGIIDGYIQDMLKEGKVEYDEDGHLRFTDKAIAEEPLFAMPVSSLSYNPNNPYRTNTPGHITQDNRTTLYENPMQDYKTTAPLHPDVVKPSVTAPKLPDESIRRNHPIPELEWVRELTKTTDDKIIEWLKEETINVRFVREGMEPIGYAGGSDRSDWIDLRSGIDVELQPMEVCSIPLGVAMELPDGYEAHIEARSSTYRNFKIIRVNSGVIDNSYKGNDDEWHFEALALEHTVIHKNDRICQFRIVGNEPHIKFNIVESLHNGNRGG